MHLTNVQFLYLHVYIQSDYDNCTTVKHNNSDHAYKFYSEVAYNEITLNKVILKLLGIKEYKFLHIYSKLDIRFHMFPLKRMHIQVSVGNILCCFNNFVLTLVTLMV